MNPVLQQELEVADARRTVAGFLLTSVATTVLAWATGLLGKLAKRVFSIGKEDQEEKTEEAGDEHQPTPPARPSTSQTAPYQNTSARRCVLVSTHRPTLRRESWLILLPYGSGIILTDLGVLLLFIGPPTLDIFYGSVVLALAGIFVIGVGVYLTRLGYTIPNMQGRGYTGR